MRISINKWVLIGNRGWIFPWYVTYHRLKSRIYFGTNSLLLPPHLWKNANPGWIHPMWYQNLGVYWPFVDHSRPLVAYSLSKKGAENTRWLRRKILDQGKGWIHMSNHGHIEDRHRGRSFGGCWRQFKHRCHPKNPKRSVCFSTRWLEILRSDVADTSWYILVTTWSPCGFTWLNIAVESMAWLQ